MAVRVNGKNVLNTTEGAALAQEGVPEAGKAVMQTDTAQGTASDGGKDAMQTDTAQGAASEAGKGKAPITEAEMARAEQEMNENLKREKTVRVKLPLIDKNEPYVEVGINGVIKLIQRGVTVDLPVSIVEVLEHAEII